MGLDSEMRSFTMIDCIIISDEEKLLSPSRKSTGNGSKQFRGRKGVGEWSNGYGA